MRVDVRLKGICTEEKENVLHILCVFLDRCLSKSSAPYCNLCPVRVHHIFPHYLIKGYDFGKEKKLLPNTKYLF